jgi:hypothetical protein
MIGPYHLTPDVWLVVSARVLGELQGRWSRLSQSTLMDLRLHDETVRLVTLVELDVLRERIERKVAEGWQRVRVVFDGYGEAEHAALRGLEPDVARHVRWHDYREDPLAVVDTLRAPEDDVLAAWQANRPAVLDLPIGGPGIDEHWQQRYIAAFRQWEEDWRAADPELFEQTFPERPMREEPVGTPLLVALAPDSANDEVFAAAAVTLRARRMRGRAGTGAVKRLKWSSETGSMSVEMQPPSVGMPIVHVWFRSQLVSWASVAAIALDLGGRMRVDFDGSSPGWELMPDGSGLRVGTDRVANIAAAMAGGVPGLTVEIVSDAE